MGRQPDRCARVGAEAEARDARGDGRRLATGGPADGAHEVIRVVGAPEDVVDGLDPAAVGREVGLGDQNRSGRAQPLDRERGEAGGRRVDVHAERERPALHGDVVLDAERDPGQRAGRALGLRPRALRVVDDDRVERARRLDAPQRVLDGLHAQTLIESVAVATDGLPASELHGLLELLGEAHHAEDLAGFRTALLDVLPRIIPAAYTSYNEVRADGTPLVTMVTPEVPDRILRNWARYGHQNPLVQHHLTTRDPRAYRLSDVVAMSEFHERELYHEVFVPLGVEHQLAVALPAPPRLLIGLAFADAHDFTDVQRQLLDLARPHLIQAHANAALRERLHDVLAAVEAGLDDIGEAIVVTDAHNRVAFATEAGREALELIDSVRLLRETPSPGHVVVPVDGGQPLMVRRLTPKSGATVFVFER